MRIRIYLAGAALAATMVGCSQSGSEQPAQPPATPTPPTTVATNKGASSPESPVVPPADGGTTPPPTPTGAGIGADKPGGTKPVLTPPASTTTTGAQNYNWQTSSASAKDIALAADKMIKGLSGVKATINYSLRIPTGDTVGTLEQKIKSPTTFSLQYPVLGKDKKHGIVPIIAYAHANGKVLTERVDKDVRSKSLGVAKPAPANLVESWPSLANREIFAGLMDGRKPITEYVSALLDPKNGYFATVKERKIPINGRMVREYRIEAVRTGGQEALKGSSAITMVFDADIHLPVSINAMVKKPGAAREDYMTWNAKWVNNSKFDSKEFLPLASDKTKA